MPLRLEIKKLLASRSERVKSCDLHPTEPWVLSALYTGHLFIWNYNTQTVVKSIEVGSQPIRCAKFIARKQWIVCGSDDMMIRVFNINTLEKIASFEGHVDYIRCLDVHPTQPYVISSSDDLQIKLWNWEANWSCTQTFEGHNHYVMQVKWNPKDSNTFASASLDKTVKMWSIGSPLPNFSLEGHELGVNALDFYPGGDKPYLVSGADDRTLKIWDYQTKSCVQTLDGHTSNVSAVCYHPKLPIILSASEDGTVRLWHSTTYRLETTLNYGLERCWALSVSPESNKVAIGYDEGTIVIGLGQDKPVVSIDSSGKVLMANNNDVVSCSMRGVSTSGVADGDRIDVQTKDLASCEVFPQKMVHNANGRFVAVCGDGEYIIYTAQALRNKSYGSALDFAWSSDGTGDYAVRESSSSVRVFKNFKESKVFKPPFTAEGLFGGNLIAIAGSEFVVFVDWEECRLVMRIDVSPREIFWSSDGERVVLACEDSYYVLECDLNAINDAFANGTANPEEGVDGSFTLLHEIGEKVESGQWVGGCFLYTNTSGRLNYYVGGEVMTLSHLDRQMYLMGYVARENRVFLIDKNRQFTSFTLLESVLQYQTAVVRGDFDLANEVLATIPREQYNDISRFLESQGHKEVALHVADDPDQKFELALQLEKLDVASEIMNTEIVTSPVADPVETRNRWKQLGDLALSMGQLDLAEECSTNALDFSGLLLMYTASGNAKGISILRERSIEAGRYNIAFICSLLLGDKPTCIQILHKAHRNAEAAFFARTYAPSFTKACVDQWKEDLAQVNTRAANALADPESHPERFPNIELALEAEKLVSSITDGKFPPATAFTQVFPNTNAVLSDLYKEHGPSAIQSLFSGTVSMPQTSVPPPQPKVQEQQQVAQPDPAPVASEQAEDEEPSPQDSEVQAAALLQQQQEAEKQQLEAARVQQEAERQAQLEKLELQKQEEALLQQQHEAQKQQEQQAVLLQEQQELARKQQQQQELLQQQQEQAAILEKQEAEAAAVSGGPMSESEGFDSALEQELDEDIEGLDGNLDDDELDDDEELDAWS